MNIRNLSLPKAVCLDLDNTLYAYSPCNTAGMHAVYTKLCNLFSICEADAKPCFEEARRQIKEQLGETASSHSRLLYFQRMIEIMGLKTQISLTLDLEQTFWRAYLMRMELFEGVKEFLYALRAKSIPIAIVSDLTAQIQFRKIMYLDIDGLIDHIVTSEEVGADKPDVRIFKLALEKLHCSSEQVWMIGDDKVKDIEGAVACGMTGLWKNEDKSNSGMSFSSFSHPLFKSFQ